MEFDIYKEHWQVPENREQLDRLVDEAKSRLSMIQQLVDEFSQSPSEGTADIIAPIFSALADILIQLDPPSTKNGYKIPSDSFRPHEKIYRSSDGGFKILPSTVKKMGGGAIDDSVQDLLNLHRTELWELDATVFAGVDGADSLALSPEQLAIMRKVKLVDPLTSIEEQLLRNPGLFDKSPAHLKRSVKTKLKGKAWAAVVNRVRALAIGLSQRGDD